MSYWWFQYPEAGASKKILTIIPENMATYGDLKAPDVDSAQTVHLILKVTDKGVPALRRYKRVVVTILPK